jgi:DNA-directed RNA polymerase specialized sigma24 family protein
VGVDDVPKLIDKLDGKRALLLIKKIPLKYRKIMLMRYAEDLTLKEISEINGQSKNTNAVQLHRGKEMIRILNNKK